MSHELIKKENGKAYLRLTAEAAAFDKAILAAYNKTKNQFNIPGFRKGKAPLSLLEKQYGESVFYEDAVNSLFPDLFEEAVRAHALEVIDRPTIDLEQIGKGQPLILTAEVAIVPEVTLGAYTDLEVAFTQEPVTELEIDEKIQELREKNARFVTVKDRPVQEGDSVVLDYEGSIEGVPFEGGKAEGHTLIIGSGQFIEGFEEQLVGLQTGEEKEIQVTFPSEYPQKDLAGKEAVFYVKIEEIKEKQLEEVDDEFVRDVSEHDSLEELRKSLREELAQSKEKAAENVFVGSIIDKAVENARVDIPPVMIESQIDQMIEEFSYQLQQQGLALKQYLEFTNLQEEDLREQMKEEAKKRVEQSLVIGAIAQKENVQVSEMDLEEELTEMAQKMQLEADKLKTMLRPQDLENIQSSLKNRKTIALLKQKNHQ